MVVIPKDREKQAEAVGVRRDRIGGLAARLQAIGQHCASLPDLDARSPDELCGYDEQGMWTT